MATMIGRETEERTTVAELARRTGDGLDVVLTWNRLTGRLWVHVKHVRTQTGFDVEAPAANALDVFYHPFAYVLADLS
jgi:hypothetical protein